MRGPAFARLRAAVLKCGAFQLGADACGGIAMRKEVETKLDELFAQGAARERAAGEAEEVRETEEEKFVHSFIKKRDAVIRPAMQAFGEYIANKGLAYEITAAESGFERTSGGDREDEPLIEITFFKGEKRHPTND